MPVHNHPFGFMYEVALDTAPADTVSDGSKGRLTVKVIERGRAEAMSAAQVRALANESLITFNDEQQWTRGVNIGQAPGWRAKIDGPIETADLAPAAGATLKSQDEIVVWVNAKCREDSGDDPWTPPDEEHRYRRVLTIA